MTANDIPSSAPSTSTALRAPRERYVDVFRGGLIAHMALDHASLMFNAGRGGEELAALPPEAPTDLFQFLTRFTGVPVAPAFFFMAGFMIALTSAGREARGVEQKEITRRLIIRGLVLIAADALIMGLPRALMGFYSFMVLSSIGVGVIVVALMRGLSNGVLLAIALAVLALHPLIDVSALPTGLQAILYEPVRTGAIRSLYPILPWSAIVILGFVIGRSVPQREWPTQTWIVLGLGALLLFLFVRITGLGNAYPYTSIAHLDFWFFAKYPPDLPFLTWSFAITFFSLALLHRLTREHVPTVLKPFEVFGRVPFFFYIVHFYVLGIAAAAFPARLSLTATYAIWIALLIVMLWPCAWYYRKKRDRPNFVTRYL